jgi:hypothetical protein
VILFKNKNKAFQYFVILVLSCIVLLQGYILFGSHNATAFFFKNLDGQRLGGFTIKDIFYWNYGWSGRQFMPRPAFFPNLLVQALVVPLGFNHFLSNLIYSISMLFITFFTFFLLFYQAVGPGAKKRLSGVYSDLKSNSSQFLSWQSILIFCLGFFSICLFIATNSNFLWSLFSTYHLENLINTILYLYCMVRLLQKPTKLAYFWVSVMIILGVISNRLFLVTAMLPAWLGILYLLISYKKFSFKKLSLWTLWQVIIALGSLSIYLLPEFFNGNLYLFLGAYSKYTDLEKFIGLFTYYHSYLSAGFVLFVFISLFGLHSILFLSKNNKQKNNKQTNNTNIYFDKFLIFTVFLAGIINLLSFILSKGNFDNFDGYDRYFIVASMLAPAMFLFYLYRLFPKKGGEIYIFLGLALLAFSSDTNKVNYKAYFNLKLVDSTAHKLASCISLYNQRGYKLENGLSTWGNPIMGYRDNMNINIAIADALYPSDNRYKAKRYYFNPIMNNSLYNIAAPHANHIRKYNFILFNKDKDNFSHTLTKSGLSAGYEKTYGAPVKILSCGKDIHIAYYGTHKAQKHFNKVLFEQLTCSNASFNHDAILNNKHFIKEALKHKGLKYLAEKFGLNKEKLATKMHQYYDCRPINNYLDAHPIYKKQVNALLNSAA